MQKQTMAFLKKHQRYLLPALAFFSGFIWDALTLGKGVSSLDLWILSAYLLATTPILWWLANKAHVQPSPKNLRSGMPTHTLQVQQVPLALSNLRIRLPYLLLQFLYGSVFSALFILYFKSASHLTALAWSIGLAGLLIANEFFEHAYKRFTLTWTLFSFCTILLFNFVIPYAIGSVSAIWFFLSVALAVMMTHFLKTAIAERVGKIWPTYALAGVLVVAYIVDVIPPVPLVKRDIQVGTQLEKTALSYRLLQDAAPFWQFWRRTTDTVHLQAGETVYCISAIYAPSGFRDSLYHHWQKYDATLGWQSMSRIGFGFSGGRNEGYRGYTYKNNVSEGQWRVSVETENAHTIGTYHFDIQRATTPVSKVESLF